MAGHAQLKFFMTECSKTQIRLTQPKRFEPENDKTNKTTWAPREDTDQPREDTDQLREDTAHPREDTGQPGHLCCSLLR